MPALVTLQGAEALTVDPGGTTSCEVKVRNTGTVVEQFHLTALGDGREWIKAEPEVLSLFPDAEGTARLVIAPPQRPETPFGEVAFAVRVVPETAPDEGSVEEGSVRVGKFDDVAAELMPLQTKSRGGSRHRIAIDSRGNAPLRVLLQVVDPGEDLDMSVRPTALTIEPGRAAFANVKIRPRKRMLTGTAKMYPFKVLAAPDGLAPIELDGSRIVQPMMPKWVVPVVAALAALIIIWLVVVKPAVKSAAKDAVATPLNEASAKADKAAADAATAASAANAAAGGGTTTSTTASIAGSDGGTTTTSSTSTTATTASTSTAASTATSSAFDNRISVVAGPGETQSATYLVPAGKTLSVTDLVAQNDNDSLGTMHVQRQTAATASPPNAITDLLTMRLETFHDQSYHFDSPLVFTQGQRIRLQVDCRPSQGACSVGLLFSGTMAG